ncbi:hypothetical protein Theam_1760 (plasmid) [Thermovibrio ammonificans HB-1]|uniref:Thioredoxin domain-containing protein n=1 Tax=Thermovibrio ammonificans (strain DSM 15698 / JCM 12110 / HB-1) TaxID=648996 RepID=E8T6Z5_THEA1|nr:thioredoxin family protein [Thermovibrio ammonificans]ADU97716.1 hypothetical protein Theam_1760 [Thermovibrio ammonificans HB-1]
MKRVLLLVLLLTVTAQAKDFNYGLWGDRAQVEKRQQVKKSVKSVPAGRNHKEETFSWQDFLPENLPRPFRKLLENPSPENVRKYWRAYEEFVSRVAEAEKQVRLLQLEFARRISSKYQLYYFFSPSCPACRRYSPLLFASLLREGFNLPTKAFVVGDLNSGRLFAAALGIAEVRQATPELLSQLGVSALPTAVLLEGDRVVAELTGAEVLKLVNFLKEKRDEAIESSVDTSSNR